MNGERVVYVAGVGETTYAVFVQKLIKKFDDRRLEIAHSGLGVTGEAGELADALKKIAIYGKPPDRKNIVEELGDLNFFMQDIQNRFHILDEEILASNAVKLGERYKGLVYTDEAAIARADKNEASFNPLHISKGD